MEAHDILEYPGIPDFQGGPLAHFFCYWAEAEERERRDMAGLEAIERMIAPTLESMGFAVVRLMFSGSMRKTLQVLAERADGRPITVEDCAAISRVVSAVLDVEDPIAGAYVLEVSSPGIDRPLIRKDDYRRFAGHEVKVEIDQPVDGQRRFKGRLEGIEGDTVRLSIEGRAVDLPFASIQKAKLVLTDALLKAAARNVNEQKAERA